MLHCLDKKFWKLLMDRRKINLSKFTTYKFGGLAEQFFTIKNESDIDYLTNYVDLEQYFILGKGSNVVFADHNHTYPIINPNLNSLKTLQNSNYLRIGSGVYLPELARHLKSNNLTGGEYMLGIPGSVGGAFCMNAGCYGYEFFDNLVSAKIFDFKSNSIKEIQKKDINYGYRFNSLSDYLLLSVDMTFNEDTTENINKKLSKYNKLRRDAQPPAIYNAGSVFKNGENYFAGELIEKAGLKGYRLEGVAVSEKHANFFIADKGAKAINLFKLVNYVKSKVYDKFDVVLQEEIIFIGEF